METLYMTDKLLDKVKNIVTREEIALYEKFLLLLQCLQKLSAAEALESLNMSVQTG